MFWLSGGKFSFNGESNKVSVSVGYRKLHILPLSSVLATLAAIFD